MDPNRDTPTIDQRIEGDVVIPPQRWSFETIYTSRMPEPAIRSPIQILDRLRLNGGYEVSLARGKGGITEDMGCGSGKDKIHHAAT